MKNETKKTIIAWIIWALLAFVLFFSFLTAGEGIKDDPAPLYRVDKQLEPYLKSFVNLAAAKDIDLTYIYNQPITIKFYTYKPKNDKNVAASYARNKDAIVILVDKEKFMNRSEEGRKYVMYHEFGHDILNFEHLEHPDRGMMEPTAYSGFFAADYSRFDKNIQRGYLWKSLHKMFDRFIEKGTK